MALWWTSEERASGTPALLGVHDNVVHAMRSGLHMWWAQDHVRQLQMPAYMLSYSRCPGIEGMSASMKLSCYNLLWLRCACDTGVLGNA
eukprot:350428-Chlamydomonas_euryale.AAC.3